MSPYSSDIVAKYMRKCQFHAYAISPSEIRFIDWWLRRNYWGGNYWAIINLSNQVQRQGVLEVINSRGYLEDFVAELQEALTK